MRPDLDEWLAEPALQVTHRRESTASAQALWQAATTIPLSDTGLLGRLVRWRIPGLERGVTFDGLFRSPPFIVLDEGERWVVSGLVGRIWTLRRDYPELGSPAEFRGWSERGTARVAFANWVAPGRPGRTVLGTEVRVQALGSQGRVGLAAVRPLVKGFQSLVGSEGLTAAVRRAERDGERAAEPAGEPLGRRAERRPGGSRSES